MMKILENSRIVGSLEFNLVYTYTFMNFKLFASSSLFDFESFRAKFGYKTDQFIATKKINLFEISMTYFPLYIYS